MPTRSPANRSAPIRSRLKPIVGEVHEALWSFPGDFTVAALDAAMRSPAWVPYIFDPAAGPSLTVLDVAVVAYERVEGATIAGNFYVRPVADVVGDNYTLATLTLSDATGQLLRRSSYAGWSPVVLNMGSGDENPLIFVDASGTGSGVIGHGLTLVMWYRYD